MKDSSHSLKKHSKAEEILTYKSSEMGALGSIVETRRLLQLEEDERVGDDFLKRLGGQIMCGQVVNRE